MRFESTALTQAQETPQIGQLVASVAGPAATTTASNGATVTILSLPVAMIAGQHYLITARCQGTIGATPPSYINAQLNDSQNLIVPGVAFIMSFAGAGYVANSQMAGGISTQIRATAAATNNITVAIQAGGTGSWSVPANSSEIVVVRIG